MIFFKQCSFCTVVALFILATFVSTCKASLRAQKLELEPINLSGRELDRTRAMSFFRRPDLLTNDDSAYGKVGVDPFTLEGPLEFFQKNGFDADKYPLKAIEIFLFKKLKYEYSDEESDYSALKAIRFSFVNRATLIPGTTDSYRIVVGAGKAFFTNNILLDLPDGSSMNAKILELLNEEYEDELDFAKTTPRPTPEPSHAPTTAPTAFPTQPPTIGETANPTSVPTLSPTLSPTSPLNAGGLQNGEVTEIIGGGRKTSPTPIVLGTLAALSLIVGAAILYKKKVGFSRKREVVADDESGELSSEGEEDYVIEITTE